MAATFHPSETTLADLARGCLKPGAAVVVRAHLETCAGCHGDLSALEAAAGALLAETPPASLEPHALERALARIETAEPAPSPAPEISTALLDGIEIPRALRRASAGPTRWMAPGVHVARLHGAAPDERFYLLRVAPGMRMPSHGHSGSELTLVLSGAFSDAKGFYAAGDLAESGEADVHQPVVDAAGPCVCLIAADGVMRMREFLPRLLQPLFGL